MKELKVVEFFGGIGACSKAFERLNIPHKVVDYVEIDESAVRSYNAVHGTNFEPQDITKWDKDIEIDFLMHGSPCQDFSVAGKQAGGDANSGTRSSLMYETLRIVEKLRPKYVVWENVKNLLSERHNHNYTKYLKTMSSYGYSNYQDVLNSMDYGIPQHRERIFTISILNNDKIYYFPNKQVLKNSVDKLLELNVPESYYLSDAKVDALLNIEAETENSVQYKGKNVELPCIGASRGRDIENPNNRIPGSNLVQTFEINTNGVANTLTSFQKDNYVIEKTKNLKTILCNKLVDEKVVKGGEIINHSYTTSEQRPNLEDYIETKNGIVPTLTTRPDILGYVENKDSKIRIRKLTPKECWRLMGFDDEDFDRASKVNSDMQLYKQARKFHCCKRFRGNDSKFV